MAGERVSQVSLRTGIAVGLSSYIELTVLNVFLGCNFVYCPCTSKTFKTLKIT